MDVNPHSQMQWPFFEDGHRSFKLEPLFLRLELYQPALLSAYPAR